MRVEVQRLAHARDLPLPGYATTGAAGLDLVAAIDNDVVLPPGRHQAVPTGIALAFVCAVKGYRCRIVCNDAVAAEKRRSMEIFGAEVRGVRDRRA